MDLRSRDVTYNLPFAAVKSDTERFSTNEACFSVVRDLYGLKTAG